MPQSFSYRFLLTALFLVGSHALGECGEPQSRDELALTALFGRDDLASNVLDLHRRVARLPPDERYRYLADKVLTAEGIRLALDYTPMGPITDGATTEESDRSRMATALQAGVRRVQTGGMLVSPVLDLIAAAQASDRIEDLAARVMQNATPSDADQRARLVVLTLIDIARKDGESANRSIVELAPVFTNLIADSRSDRVAATLLAWTGIQHPETRETALELVANLLASVQYGTRTGTQAVWDGQLFMFPGYARALGNAGVEASEFSLPPPLRLWRPVSRSDARTRGLGWPLAHWLVEDGSPAGPRIVSLTGHFQDYLFFQCPMYGEYGIECDVTPGAWSEGHLLVAGWWVAPFTNSEIRFGTLRSESRRFIEPRRPASDEWMHFRAVVADDKLSVSFDGHPVFEESLPPDHDPWVAIRSRCEHQTAVRDLRISGHPVVPARIAMARSPELTGWTAYFDESIGGPDADWRLEDGVILGTSRPEGVRSAGPTRDVAASLPQDRESLQSTRGVGDESLLQYFRPLLEDGAIEYEFLYEPDRIVAHPALDRLALLLRPDGVRGHWLTDGRYERTGADPLGTFIEPECRRSEPVLLENEWNHVNLEITGDTLRLYLNGELIYERPIELTNELRFGLFHYADRSEARVRNIVWHGGWERAVPPVDQQELADPRLARIEARSAELPQLWEHGFGSGILADSPFECAQPILPRDIETQPDGLKLVRHGAEGWVEHNLQGLFRIGGDFDVSATFDQPGTRFADPNYQTATLLQVICQSDARDSYHIGGRFFQNDHQVIETTHNWRKPDGAPDWDSNSLPQACRGGTLRLVRHGERMLSLFADGASDQFRIIDEQPAARGDVELRGVRLLTQACGVGASNSVVWKALSIRAERFELDDRVQLVEDLNRQRESLASESYDFAAQGVDNDVFAGFGEDGSFQNSEDGLRTVINGRAEFLLVSLVLQRRLVGDFDVSVDFRTLRGDTPIDTDNSGAWLNLRTAGADPPSFNLLAATFPGPRYLVHAMTERTVNGKPVPFLKGDVECRHAGRLRFARRGTNLYLLYRPADAERDQLVTTETIGTEDVPVGGLCLMTHPGGEGRQVEIMWHHARICAERIERQ